MVTAQERAAYVETLSSLGNAIVLAGVPVDILTITAFFNTHDEFKRHIASAEQTLANRERTLAKGGR